MKTTISRTRLCVCLLVVYLSSIVQLVEGIPNFYRGRRFNHIKKSENNGLFLLNSPIPEQYYDQRLDHFNEAQITTWKQVIKCNNYNPVLSTLKTLLNLCFISVIGLMMSFFIKTVGQFF